MSIEGVNKKLIGPIRRCLTARYILRSRQRAIFQQLASQHEELQKYFAQMGADLVVNESLGIAYLEPTADLEEEMEYRLGRSVTLGPIETLVLLFVRQKRLEHFIGDAGLESPSVSRAKLREFLAEFSREKEDRKFQAKFEKALDRLTELQVLLPLPAEGQFEISPVCDVLLPGDRVTALRDRAREYFSAPAAVREDAPQTEEGP